MKNPADRPATAIPSTLTDADFDAALDADERPLLIDFHADWCPPCRALAPIVAQLAASHVDRLRVARVDIDANPALVERFGIASVPTLVLLRGADELDRLVGITTARALAARIATALADED